jgi:transposase-like protein
MSRKYVCPNQDSIDKQKDCKEGYSFCTKCETEKPSKEFARKNWYWCKKCHREYTRKRPQRVSYNQLW